MLDTIKEVLTRPLPGAKEREKETAPAAPPEGSAKPEPSVEVGVGEEEGLADRGEPELVPAAVDFEEEGGWEAMHDRHERERKAMHRRHEREREEMRRRHEQEREAMACRRDRDKEDAKHRRELEREARKREHARAKESRGRGRGKGWAWLPADCTKPSRRSLGGTEIASSEKK